MVLLHSRMVGMVARGRIMECGRVLGAMVNGAPMMLLMGWRRVITMLLLTLLARMRLLCRVIDIVVPYSVVARQCASNTWVPPERTALDGRRALK